MAPPLWGHNMGDHCAHDKAPPSLRDGVQAGRRGSGSERDDLDSGDLRQVDEQVSGALDDGGVLTLRVVIGQDLEALGGHASILQRLGGSLDLHAGLQRDDDLTLAVIELVTDKVLVLLHDVLLESVGLGWLP